MIEDEGYSFETRFSTLRVRPGRDILGDRLALEIEQFKPWGREIARISLDDFQIRKLHENIGEMLGAPGPTD